MCTLVGRLVSSFTLDTLACLLVVLIAGDFNYCCVAKPWLDISLIKLVLDTRFE